MKQSLLLLAMGALVSCGKFPIETQHTLRVEGQATVEHKLNVSFEVCDTLPLAERVECVESLLEVLKVLVAQEEALNESGFE